MVRQASQYIVPRLERTTGICPGYGAVGDKLPLNVRVWTCDHCCRKHDRDIAAARVLIRLEIARSAGKLMLVGGYINQTIAELLAKIRAWTKQETRSAEGRKEAVRGRSAPITRISRKLRSVNA